MQVTKTNFTVGKGKVLRYHFIILKNIIPIPDGTYVFDIVNKCLVLSSGMSIPEINEELKELGLAPYETVEIEERAFSKFTNIENLVSIIRKSRDEMSSLG